MSVKRDPTDRRYHERLAGSSLASILLHVLLAALLFAVVANSSQEGATENTSGGDIVTIEHRTPIVAQVAAAPQAAAPQPFAPRIAPVHHTLPVPPARQPRQPGLHELSKFAPTAPPNPSPLPQASVAPAPRPTQAVAEPLPTVDVAAVPIPLPSAVNVAVTVKTPPTSAPSPVPTRAPTASPVPKPPQPTAAPTRQPATPAPVASPTAAPSAAAVVAAAPLPHPSAAPATTAGVPSPNPTRAPAPVAKAAGTAATPGPKGLGSPGPRAGTAMKSRPAPAKPVEVAPTAAPARSTQGGIDLNARLRAMLPHNAVSPQSKSYTQMVSLSGRMEPTPPPDVLAETKFLFDEIGSGGDERVKMWVTTVEQRGPLTLCIGWMLRYPEPIRNDSSILGPSAGTRGTGALPTQVRVSGTSAGLSPLFEAPAPIVVANASTACSRHLLQPFSPGHPSP